MSLLRPSNLLVMIGLCGVSSPAIASPARARALPPPEPIDRPFDVLDYDLSINLNPSLQEIDAQAKISVQLLDDSAVLEFDLSGLAVSNVAIDGVSQSFNHSNDIVQVFPDSTLLQGESHVIAINYGGTPYTGSNRLGLTIIPPGSDDPNAEGVVFTITEPDGSKRWFPCNDTPADKATLRLEVTVPNDWSVASNGVLTDINEEKLLFGTQELGKTFVWEESHQIATYLTTFAAAPYLCFDDENEPSTEACYNFIGQNQDREGYVPLQYFARPGYAELAQAQWQVTTAQVQTFSDLFVDYPFDKYGAVEAPMHYSGMEHQTMTLWSSSRLTNDSLESAGQLSAHELAHHWFGDFVTPSDWNDIWLNEGWATYSESLWREEKARQEGGDEAAAEALANSIKGAQDNYLAFHSSDNDTSVYAPEEMFGITSYSKGATIVHMLRYILGDDGFLTMTRQYLEANAFGNATTFDLIEHAEAVYGADLNWFFEPYVFTSDNPFPELQFAWEKQGRNVTVGISQLNRQPIFTLRIPIEVTLASGEVVMKDLWVQDEPGTQFRLEFDSDVEDVRLDPQNWWLADIQFREAMPDGECGSALLCDGMDDSACVGAPCEGSTGSSCDQSMGSSSDSYTAAALLLGLGLLYRRRSKGELMN